MFQYQDFESSGNPILIQNETTALSPIINELHIYGGSYQNKITGSQLLNPSLFEDNKTDGGITYTKQKDGSIIINGTLEEGKRSTFQLGDYIDSLEDGKHYIYKSDSDAGVLNIGYNDGTPNDYVGDVTVDKKRMAYIKCYIQFTQKYPPTKTHLFPMLNEGTVVKPFEHYTGGKTSPSPEIPAEIINKGKNGTVNVYVRGKNLIDYTKAKGDADIQFVDGGFIVGGDERNRIINLPCNIQKGKSYTIDFKENHLLGNNDVMCYLPGGKYSVSGNAPQQYGIIKKRPFIANDDYTAFGIYHELKNVSVSKSEITDICLVKTGMDITYEPYHTPQSLTLATPNGLPGVPVDKNGNYTDQNGQQWVCDEIDLTKKKYVQRVKDFIITQDTQISTSMGTYGAPEKDTILARYLDRAIKKNGAILCRELIHIPNWNVDSESVHTTETSIDFRLSRKRLGLGTETTADENKTAVLKFLETTPLHCLVELNTPIERDLTPEEISAYESIVTHNDTTVISNNENCNMKITYTKGVLMPKYDSTKLIVQMKALARTESMPIDSTEVWDSLAEAQSYVKEANAYAGQTIKALVNGKYKTYTLQPSGGGYTLEEVGAVSQSDLKQYVQVVERLPESGQQQGVIYIVGTTGQIWTGSAWKVVFKEVSAQVDQLTSKVTKLEGDLAKKAPINNPVFTGKVMVGSDEVAVKSYVDGLISNLVSSAPGVVDGDHPLPADGYKAGQTWRVALAGTYAGQKCEVGDLIICVKNFNTKLNNSDFMVVQANVDGAVTSTAATSTVGEIVVFNAATGKVIKGSGVNISSLNDAISKAHTHANKTILDSYDKDQTQLLADAAATAQSKVDALKTEVNKKANKATTLAGYGITDAYTEAEIDAKLKTITDNVNTKVDAATVDSKIDTAKGEIETAYNKAITEKLAARVGSIPEDTDIKTYVDTAIGSGGTASAEAIAKAKQEAINASKQYTDSQLQVTEF